MNGPEILLCNITVEIKERHQKINKTFNNVSFIDQGLSLYKGNKIVKIEKIGILGKASRK